MINELYLYFFYIFKMFCSCKNVYMFCKKVFVVIGLCPQYDYFTTKTALVSYHMELDQKQPFWKYVHEMF